MSKKKFTLTSDIVQLSPEETSHHEKNLSKTERITITLLVDKPFRTEIKTWCASKNITLVEAVKKGFQILKATYDK